MKNAVAGVSRITRLSAGDETTSTRKSRNLPRSSPSACLTRIVRVFPAHIYAPQQLAHRALRAVSLATLTVPATVTPSDDGLFGVAALSSPNPNKEGSSPEGAKKEEDGGDKDGDGSGVVKANKGMILRKSVEYIRWASSPCSSFLPSARFVVGWWRQG